MHRTQPECTSRPIGPRPFVLHCTQSKCNSRPFGSKLLMTRTSCIGGIGATAPLVLRRT